MPRAKRHRNLSRGHLTQKQHMKLLSVPNFRVLRDNNMKKKYIPNFELDGEPLWPVSEPALRAKPSKRIQRLAAPKASADSIAFKREIIYTIKQKRPEIPEPIPGPDHYVNPPALTAEATSRVNRLSVAKKQVCESNIDQFQEIVPQKFLYKMEEQLKDYIVYPRTVSRRNLNFHSESHLLAEKRVKRDKWISKPVEQRMTTEYWEKYKQRLSEIAHPKKVFQPEPLPERPTRPLVALEPRLETLSRPKYMYEPPIEDDVMFKVPEAALDYKPTPRIIELAQHRPVLTEEPHVLTLSGVSPAALSAVVTERIKTLATPMDRKQNKEELNEDAFRVNPRALKAICTKRVQQLARPIERK